MIAVAGDRVEIAPRSVTVNGRRIPVAGAPGATAAPPRVETIPPGHVFLLGDNPAASIDSRSFGALPVREIVGREVLTPGRPRTVLLTGLVALCAAALIVAAAARVRARSRTRSRR